MATFTNQATISYTGGTVLSNIAYGELTEVLSATKASLQGSYTVGEHVTYVISIFNSGTTDITGLTVTDDLAAVPTSSGTANSMDFGNVLRYYVNGVLQEDPSLSAGTTLEISNITVPAGGNAQIIYEAIPNSFANPNTGGTITNTVTMSGAGITAYSTEDETPIGTEPVLSIEKSVSPIPVLENSPVTYTFRIYNSSPAPAEADAAVILSDTFDPRLESISVTFNGTPWTQNNQYTYNASTGAFATAAGLVTVSGATATQNINGSWTISPGVSTLVVTGTV